MIFEGSRYTKTPLLNYDETYSFSKRAIVEFNLEYSDTHTVVQGDSYDNLANTYYENPQLWWVILDANKDKISGYFEGLVPGTTLSIPYLSYVKEVLNQWF